MNHQDTPTCPTAHHRHNRTLSKPIFNSGPIPRCNSPRNRNSTSKRKANISIKGCLITLRGNTVGISPPFRSQKGLNASNKLDPWRKSR